jgi:8-oxo-dGTP diphosphatase
VDLVIEFNNRQLLLIKRRNPPFGWALPGGFIDYNETAEQAACREAREETGLDVRLLGLVGVYSEPDRDPRQHTLSVVYAAKPLSGQGPRAGDDALQARGFDLQDLPDLAFDHARIIQDYQRFGYHIGSSKNRSSP